MDRERVCRFSESEDDWPLSRCRWKGTSGWKEETAPTTSREKPTSRKQDARMSATEGRRRNRREKGTPKGVYEADDDDADDAKSRCSYLMRSRFR